MEGKLRREVRLRRAAAATVGVAAALACALTPACIARADHLPGDSLAPIAQAEPTPVVERLSGPTRIQTAIAISQRLYPAGAPAVVVATGDAFPDALAGGPLAHVVGGPLLLVKRDALGADVAAELTRLGPDRVFVLGGEAAVSAGVEADIDALGDAAITRLSGATRYDTAAAIAQQMRAEGASSATAIVVSGRAWPDAATSGPLASVLSCPIVLTDGASLPAPSRDTLTQWGTTSTLVVGGSAVVPDSLLASLPGPERLGGVSRYDTARLVAERGLASGLAEGTIVFASGQAFPDALAGAPLAADALAPIVLSKTASLSSEALQFVSDHAQETTRVVLLGGTAALSPAVESAILSALGVSASAEWPDTTDGVFVFSDQVDESISSAQMQFIATHYVGSQKQTRSFARELRAYDPGYLVIHYRLGLGLGYQWDGNWIQIIEGDDWVREWPASPADSWFYLYGDQRVLQHQWGWYLIDVDDPAWRTWWTAEVERQVAANEDDGLFIDSYSVPNYLGGDTYTPSLPAFDASFEAEWTARMDRYSTYLAGRSALRPVIANAGQWVTSRDAVDYSLLDGVMIEGLGMWGPGWPFDEGDWALQQDRIMSLARQGRIILGQAYLDAPGEYDVRRLALGSYLMSKGARSYLCLELGAEPEWFPEYDLDLGAPTDSLPSSADDFRLTSGLYRRRFENGVVLVNPTAAPITVSVAEVAGAGTWNRATFSGGGALPEDASTTGMSIVNAPVTEITVAAYDAAFLVRP